MVGDEALFAYKCSDVYLPDAQLVVRWNDPRIGIEWPREGEATVSERDAAAPLLEDIPPESLPAYEG